jgi:broad specificity phosphatase PhoE
MRSPGTPRPLLTLLAASMLLLGSHASLLAREAGVTTIVVVRHAEKAADSPDDPSLTPAGQKRAEDLAAVLEGARISAIYSTPFKRTHATVEPLAKKLGLTILDRPMTGANRATYAGDLAREVLKQHRGKTVLIVGHSNTVPDIVKAFSHIAVPPLTDMDYDRLFIIEVPAEGPARLFKVRYGEKNP